MNPQHHLSEDLLLAWSTGEACEARRLLCATHLTLCPACRARVTELEQVGGALLDRIEPVASTADGLAALFERIDQKAPEPQRADTPPAASMQPRDLSWVLPGKLALPRPIAAYIEDGAQWEAVLPGRVWQLTLPLLHGDTPVRLTRVKAGFRVPTHTHQGLEMNLVLSGGFHDGSEEFNRGDVAINDETVSHTLTIDPGDDCVILAVNEAPLQPLGIMSHLADWLTGGF